MNFMAAFKNNKSLIEKLGEGNAYLIWVMTMYLDSSEPIELASESLTDGRDDKKIDFIRIDRDAKKIIFAQGYYSGNEKDKAPSNKASDLNTASAWLLSGDVDNIPVNLSSIIEECREALQDGDVTSIDLLYVHNMPESVNVSRELVTASEYLKKALSTYENINVFHRELGLENIERLYSSRESTIIVKDDVICPSSPVFIEESRCWRSAVLSVPGSWLRDLFLRHGEDLFSANYRGFLGITKRRKINSGIRASAENSPNDFWVFNNGITILTNKFENNNGGMVLTGISVINGAQTTGSIGSVDSSKSTGLGDLKVLCRIIECSDPELISNIVKYNNTQNEITTWDQYSNNPEQKRISDEFKTFGWNYSLKRGYEASGSDFGIEVVAQPLIALEGNYQDANRGKNSVFERKNLYKQAFDLKKARHILFAYTLDRAIDERRLELKQKDTDNSLIDSEKKQLILFRNLRFKNFFISIVGRCFEQLIGIPVDLSEINFSPEASKRENYSLNDIIAIWSPIITMMLAYTAAIVGKDDISLVMKSENGLHDISSKVGSIIYASLISGSIPKIDTFKEIVCAKG